MVRLGLAVRRSTGRAVTDSRLAKVLAAATAVLFDFDGPVCSLFAGFPAPLAAAELRKRLEPHRGESRWSHAGLSDDPMRVLADAATWGPSFGEIADSILTELETTAARTAAPTPGGAASMRATVASGRRIAVVSNNSAESVRAFFAERPLPQFADGPIVGRRFGRPELMKPHPAPILETLRLIDVSPEKAVLIGDSLTDLIAARAAGVACIAFADKPGKDALLADADAVIGSMQILTEQLGEVPAQNDTR